MFRVGKPRYWVTGYDTKFLAVPGLLALVIAGIIWLPKPPPPRPVIAPPPPPPMAATVILRPPLGSVLPANENFMIAGVAEPGSSLQLIYIQRGQDLSRWEQIVATNGAWAFSLARLPPGWHTFRAIAFKGGKAMPSGEVSYLCQTVAKRAAPQKPANAPKPAKKQ
jgi:hypothetical protein